MRHKIFVIMPFKPEFDDVYMVIKDACRDRALDAAVECLRADEIAKPGRITDQVLGEIAACAVVIADLTGSNPNVMYELGYAQALRKPALILNQSVQDSPFDVKDMRQIVYDRSRLVRDCRPQMVTALMAVIEDIQNSVGPSPPTPIPAVESAVQPLPPKATILRASSEVASQVQGYFAQLKLAAKNGRADELQELATALLALANRVAPAVGVSAGSNRVVAAAIGNCAVVLEQAQMAQFAEDLYKRAITIEPNNGGTHAQYADFLADMERFDEATAELRRASALKPGLASLRQIETKIALGTGDIATSMDAARLAFDADPSDSTATSYLAFLSQVGGPVGDELRRVCQRWQELVPESAVTADRVLADFLAGNGQRTDAADIYHRLLPLVEPSERPDVLHNLATVLNSQGAKDRAIECWTEAYQLKPNDPAIRSSFSQMLSLGGRLEDAVRVASGQPLTP